MKTGRHPGFDWLVTPTADWPARADRPIGGPFAWCAYRPDGTRTAGFAQSQAAAVAQAQEGLPAR